METMTIQTSNYLCRPKKGLFGGLFKPSRTLSHSALPHLSVDPLVLPSMGVAGAESRAIGISLCPTAIISFALTTHLLFTFTPECGRQRGPSQRQWQEQEMMDMKMSFFFPPSLSRCGVISCQSLVHGQEYTHAEVFPATFRLLILLLNMMNSAAHSIQLQCNSEKFTVL